MLVLGHIYIYIYIPLGVGRVYVLFKWNWGLICFLVFFVENDLC